uniref:U-limacoditoxin(3)-Dv33 n=1 Tax=Doratifera vulnerans TaxID=1372962 RepID=U333_DORVU|nr:RecName: Full=U-limacoditoxin(3)-Dv33; Short=U-LCTX(3)-Dv33; AltName: Full=Cecropin-like peptide; AltName: Full=Vulnericin; Flags: Precursor [Doratifera vulnerans]QTY40810.1 venom polypeptide precursor [Doratifera vulnerans]
MSKVILLCLIFALFACSISALSKNKNCLKLGQKCNFEKKRCCTGLNCYISQNKCLPVKL